MNKETEKLHQTQGRPNFSLLIQAHNGIGPGHDYFPYDFFNDLVWLEETILRYIGSVGIEFKFDEIPCAHPEVVDVPALEDVSEVFSEE